MPTYNVALNLTPPPKMGDDELVELLRQVFDPAICVSIAITPRGLILECDPASLGLLETTLRVKLGARGGTLDSMIARPI